MQWKPNVTVAAIACMDDRFLLVEEYADGRYVYNQPAGHLEQHESLAEAVRREVLEETAWHFVPEYLTGIYLYPDPHNGITYLRFCFFGTCHEQERGRPLDQGIIQAIWLSRSELVDQEHRLRSPLVLRSIDDYLSGKYYPLEILNNIPGNGGSKM